MFSAHDTYIVCMIGVASLSKHVIGAIFLPSIILRCYMSVRVYSVAVKLLDVCGSHESDLMPS